MNVPDPVNPAPAETVSTPSPITTPAVLADVTLPFESIVNTGIAVPEPYEPAVTPELESVSAPDTFAEPLKLTVHEASPVAVMLLVVSSVVAVDAFPVTAPVRLP